MKKILFTFFLAVATCGMMASAATKYEINIAGTEVTSDNCNNITGSAITVTEGCSSGHVTYAPSTKTLLFYNITISRTGTDKYGIHNRGCDNLKIEFVGNCKVATDDNALKLERATTLTATSGSTTTFSSSSRICANLKSYTYNLNGSGNFRFEAKDNAYEAIKGDGRTNTTVNFSGPRIEAYSKQRSAISSFKAIFNSGNHLVIEKNGSDASVSGVEMVFNGREAVVSPYKAMYTNNYDVEVGYNNPVTNKDIIITDDYVAILNTAYFPDQVFCDWLYGAYFSKGYINSTDVTKTTSLEVNDSYVTSIVGVGYFSNLKTLKCTAGGLTSLPSLPTTLTYLDCSGNSISALPGLPSNIEYLNVSRNNFTELSVTNKPKLKTIVAENCQFLTSLSAFNNALTAISYSGDSKLQYLYLQNNKLTSIQTTTATTINCANNLLTSLPPMWYSNKNIDISNNKFVTLSIKNITDLHTLNVSNNTLLTSLEVSNTSLSSLTMTGCTALKTLNLTNNKFTSLDLASCSALTTFDCHGNQLTSLTNIPNSVQSINCSNNKLTSLSVQDCSKLTYIDCSVNQIKESGMNTLVNSLRTIPSDSTGDLRVLYPGYSSGGYTEGNVITTSQVNTARNKRWIPRQNINGSWVEIPGSLVGDVNGDGKVNVSDVSALINMIMSITPMNQTLADVNGDGKVNVSDVSALINIILDVH